NAISFAKQVAEELQGRFVLLDESCDTARVVLDNDINLDFAGLVGGKLETDLARRDFTINALAWNAESPDEIVDQHQGLEDLKNGIIRAISEKNLIEDPLRMLRAFRFATTLGGTIEPATISFITKHANKLAATASER